MKIPLRDYDQAVSGTTAVTTTLIAADGRLPTTEEETNTFNRHSTAHNTQLGSVGIILTCQGAQWALAKFGKRFPTLTVCTD